MYCNINELSYIPPPFVNPACVYFTCSVGEREFVFVAPLERRKTLHLSPRVPRARLLVIAVLSLCDPFPRLLRVWTKTEGYMR